MHRLGASQGRKHRIAGGVRSAFSDPFGDPFIERHRVSIHVEIRESPLVLRPGLHHAADAIGNLPGVTNQGLLHLHVVLFPGIEGLVRRGGIDVFGGRIEVIRGVGQQGAGKIRRPAECGNVLSGDGDRRVALAGLNGRRPRRHDLDLRVHPPHRLREHVVLDPVLIGGHEAHLLCVPHLIADVPPGHLVRLRMAIGGPPLAHRRIHRTADVLDLFSGRMRVAETGIHANVRFQVEQLVEDHVVVDAQVVLLHFAPGGVEARGPFVGVADGIPPVPGGDHIPTRPAEHRRPDLLHLRDQIRAIAVQVVGRHQRHGADVERPFPGSHDFEAGVGAVRPGREAQGKLGVFGSERLDGDGLPVARIGTPDEADLHFRPRIGRQDHAAGVLPAFSESQARLLDAMRRGGLQLHHGAVLAHVDLLPVHHYELVRTQGPKPGRRGPSPAPRGSFGFLAGVHRMEELPVSEHLGPKAALVVGLMKFREKPIHVRGDGRTSLGGVDRHSYWLRASTVGKKTDGHRRQQDLEESLRLHESPHLFLPNDLGL